MKRSRLVATILGCLRAWAPLVAVACSSTSGGQGGGLSGPKAFQVTSALLLPGAVGCTTPNPLASGGPYAVSVVLGDAPLAARGCGDSGAGSDAGVPHVLQIQVASPAYIAGATSKPALQTGVAYPILNEGVPDEDLCGNVPSGVNGGGAIVTYGACASSSACNTILWAVSGSVTLTSASATSVAGTFQVELGDTHTRTASGGSLSGTFSATPCPG